MRTKDDEDMLTWEDTAFIVWLFVVVIIPTIAFLGILGNVTSMFVLARHKLVKSYSIMLMVLAVADTTFLCAMFLYLFVAVAGFNYIPDTSNVMFYIFQLICIMDYAGGWISFTMPVLITTERLVAVFFPLKCSQVMTPYRTKVASASVTCLWVFIIIYLIVKCSLDYEYGSTLVNVGDNATNDNRNKTYQIGWNVIELSKYRNRIDEVYIVREVICHIFFGPAICFVFIACVMLSIKIKRSSVNRQRLTSGTCSSKSSNKGSGLSQANGMLLLVCFAYTFVGAIMFLLHSDLLRRYYSESPETVCKMNIILKEVINLAVCLNSSVNFLIYVVLNQMFRKTYFDMIRPFFQRLKQVLNWHRTSCTPRSNEAGNPRQNSEIIVYVLSIPTFVKHSKL